MKLCYHCMRQIEDGDAQICPQCGRSLTGEPVGGKYLQPGSVLQGKFVVGYPLGAGGFGNAYVGWNRALQCRVAIKEFYPDKGCSRAPDKMSVTVPDEERAKFQAGLKKFLEEARNVASLKDIPGVVTISSFFEENQTGYFVMEHLEGMDVKTILSQSGRKDYEWCRKVILSALYTLREVHRRGLLHRDISPDNIFITNEGVVKLLDFGASERLSAISENKPEIVLKMGYAPIEQYSKNSSQGPHTDLYGVAALFYRMLTGLRPIPANERLEQDDLRSPSDMGIQMPRQAEMGMMACLSVQPQYRLKSADEFIEALDGKDFEPVCEADEELGKEVKAQEEERGIRKKISRLPVGAQAGLILGGFCLIAVAVLGLIRLRGRGAGRTALTNETVVMNDLSGMTRKEAAASIEELKQNAQEKGITLDIKFKADEYIFDLDPDRNGKVASQTIKPMAVLYDPNAESQEEIKGLKRDADGNISGSVSCSLYSSAKLHYEDLSGLNAYAIAQKLGIDVGDEEHFTGTDEAEDSSYYDLIRLETPDGQITAKELGKKENRKKEITYKKGKMRIIYSNIPFLYWEALPDFKESYHTLDAIPPQDAYIWKDETSPERTDQSKSLKDVSGMVDDAYCVIAAAENSKGLHKGDIIEQTLPAGQELDASKAKLKEPLLRVVGEEVLYSGKTGDQVKKELSGHLGEKGKIVAGGSEVMSQPVSSVTIADEKGASVDYFRKGDAVTVTLKLQAVPTPEPEPAYTEQEVPVTDYLVGSAEGSGYTGGGDAGGDANAGF